MRSFSAIKDFVFPNIFFQRGEIIDVITMNPSGLWKGRTRSDGRVGNFKFINVEVLREEEKRRRTTRRSRRNSLSSRGREEEEEEEEEPTTVEQLLRKHHLQVRGQ